MVFFVAHNLNFIQCAMKEKIYFCLNGQTKCNKLSLQFELD